MTVTYEARGDVALITLDRPDRYNSISAELSQSLLAALDRAGREARAAVLTGRGKAFCAGADLSDLMDGYRAEGPDLRSVIEARFNPLARALIGLPVPTVAAVNGAAAGAGVGLALACDLRVMAPDAYLLSAFIGLGLIPDTGSSWLLVRHLGLSRAIEFTARNRRMLAEEAAALGLAHQVAAPDSLLATALSWAADLATGPTSAYGVNRRLLLEAAASDFSSALDRERDTQGELGRSPAHLEGMRAFVEKRPPDFGGSG
jgi:2-(1,2-epoxy-1,2-dihydrophenyl)acetyl-CoA isomerase